MIENIIESVRKMYETNPTSLVSLPLLGCFLLATGGLVYSLIKNPPKSIEIEERGLREEDYSTLIELRERGLLREDEGGFHIDRRNLTAYDLEQLTEN